MSSRFKVGDVVQVNELYFKWCKSFMDEESFRFWRKSREGETLKITKVSKHTTPDSVDWANFVKQEYSRRPKFFYDCWYVSIPEEMLKRVSMKR